MTHARFTVFLSTLIFGVLGCQPGQQDSSAERAAPQNVEESFFIRGAEAAPGDRASSSPQIGIHRESLEKEFLLQGEMISQPVVAHNPKSLSPESFTEKRDQYLIMLESTKGHSVSSAIKQSFLLARFKITDISKDFYYFTNEGMSQIFWIGEPKIWRVRNYNSRAWNFC